MSGIERWEDLLWDRVPHIVKYTRTSLDWVDKHVKLTFGLQKLNKDYAKGLSKLVKAHREKGVDGRSLRKCWVGVITHLGSVADKHRQLATILGDVGKKYQEEADALTEEQRTLEQNARKVQGDLDANYLLLEKSKEKYFKKQLEAQKADEVLLRGEDDETVGQNDLDKLRDGADDKKHKYDKAREEYINQLRETNKFQREFYDETWPSILSGMRGVSERSVECITSLLRRLDNMATEEWGDLGLLSDELEACMEDDFESFLNWAKSGNPLPSDFSFEESFTPGSISFSTMGTLRKSISRASLRISGSPARGGFGSRLSLRSPAPHKREVTPRFTSLRVGHTSTLTRMSSSIREDQEEEEEHEDLHSPPLRRIQEPVADRAERARSLKINRHSRNNDNNSNSNNTPISEEAGDEGEDDDGNHVPRDHSTHTGHAKEGHKNGLASNGRMTSYDDSMNPFADDD